MGEARKRVYDEMADDSSDENQDPAPRRVQRRSRCVRTVHNHRASTSFAQLDYYYNFETDLNDVLEDYLSPQKLRNIMPLVLDVSTGSWENVDQHSYGDLELKAGTNVSLLNGTFLRIQDILMDSDLGDIVLRGQRFLRTSRLRPILDDGTDEKELFWDLRDVKGSERCVKGQSLVDVPLRMVESVVQLYLTNYERSTDAKGSAFFCRWKLTRYYQDSKNTRKSIELAIERLRSLEADREFRISDDVLKFNWRGTSIKNTGNFYTALDGFCCSGGWSRGASMAGDIRIVRSFDLDEKACESYRTNFPETNCLNVDVFDYCLPQRLPPDLQELATDPEYVDIAHYSTPCQFFSPAHTRAGPNDEKNFAASFCLASLLDKDRPRAITFENTFGLERCHFSVLKAIFGQITSRGYSLRFSTLNLANWGLPQKRKRLVMLASCPGEPLPTFPEPTHSSNAELPGTLPWVTMLETIDNIPFNGWQNHNPKQMKKTALPTKLKLMADTITCSGGNQSKHPAGRLFTICEFQLLQGFPLHHRYAKGLSRRMMLGQIGNAFPPLFVKKLLRHVRRQLQKTDGIPESIDEDEFMSVEELREQEIAQFFVDHERLPEGSRANVHYTDPADYSSEDDIDTEEFTVKDEESEEEKIANDMGLINSQRPGSSGSDSNASSPDSDSVEEVISTFDRLDNFQYSLGEILNSNPWHRLLDRPSTSASLVRKFNSLRESKSVLRAQSLPIRPKLVARSRNSSPESPDSAEFSAAQSGHSIEDAIELD